MTLPIGEGGNDKVSLQSDLASVSEIYKAVGACDDRGDYAAAAQALGDWWEGVGIRPAVERLGSIDAARLLFCVGMLTRRIGHAEQVSGALEAAKDLLTEAQSRFTAEGDASGASAAGIEIATCYWWQSFFDEARIRFRVTITEIDERDTLLRAKALLRLAQLENSSGRIADAEIALTQAEPYVDAAGSVFLRGLFRTTRASVQHNLGLRQNSDDYFDRVVMDYTAAKIHFEEAGNLRYCATVENNLGDLYYRSGDYRQAKVHLDEAIKIVRALGDERYIAHFEDTLARVLIGEGHYREATALSRRTVKNLEGTDQQSLLVEALTTFAVASARNGRRTTAYEALERAMGIGEQCGDEEGAGRAALTIIEEIGASLPLSQLTQIYRKADHLLARAQHKETLERLRECARRLLAYDVRAFNARAPLAPPDPDVPVFYHAAPETAQLLYSARQVATRSVNVLLAGETGTGKEVLARLMHTWSGRRGEFVAVNCGTLSESLFESQLFGHRKGSFTGAHSNQPGAARQAAGGTLFLDEVGELSPANQVKLLRLVENHEIHPLGAPMPERVDLHIIAATNRDLYALAEQGSFRGDLLYRLAQMEINLPPLRERPLDVSAIARHFIDHLGRTYGTAVTFTDEAVEALQELPLKGNARELRFIIERAFVTAAPSTVITAATVKLLARRRTGAPSLVSPWRDMNLKKEVSEYERSLIEIALEACGGQIGAAAQILGVSHQTLGAKINNQYPTLSSIRRPPRERRSSIITKVHTATKKRKRE